MTYIGDISCGRSPKMLLIAAAANIPQKRFDSIILLLAERVSVTPVTVTSSQSQPSGSVASNSDPPPLVFHLAQPLKHLKKQFAKESYQSDNFTYPVDMPCGRSYSNPMFQFPHPTPNFHRLDAANFGWARAVTLETPKRMTKIYEIWSFMLN